MCPLLNLCAQSTPSKKEPPHNDDDQHGPLNDGAATETPAPKRNRPVGVKAAKAQARAGFPCPTSPGTGKAGLAADISRSVAETNGALLGVVAGVCVCVCVCVCVYTYVCVLCVCVCVCVWFC
jgi:hypothetical protein